MHLHRSNRAEALAERLARVVASPSGGPLSRECIVVQGRGMERWLSHQLADRLGVCANVEFPFPRKLVDRAFDAVLGTQERDREPYEIGALGWRVARLLRESLDGHAFTPVRNYLSGDDDGVRLLQLAGRVAATFDRYVVYRPDVVTAWEAGAEQSWQAELWRGVVSEVGPHHVAARAARFFPRVMDRERTLAGFPHRVCLFGIATLPPLYLKVLSALSHRVEVHAFVLSPSREYWADVRSHREIHRARMRDGVAPDVESAGLYLEEGNPLLASLGSLQRDFQQILEGSVAYEEAPEDLYGTDDASGSALSILQSDVLGLRHRGQAGVPAMPLAEDDGSIAIHACHGAMRELEVLHDQLVSFFEADPGLEPHHVVVMTHDVELYAPLIDAVFGGGGTDRPKIPYRIADRRVRATHRVVDAFGHALDVVQGRMPATAVVDLLAADVVRERFDISVDQLAVVREWVAETGIRFAVDASHREELEQPPLGENSWRFGLDRLLLGYAVAGGERQLYGGVLPYDDVEGSRAEVLGRFVEFCEALFALRKRCAAVRPASEWRSVMLELLSTLIVETDDNAGEHQAVRDAVGSVLDGAALAGFDTPLPLDVVRGLVDQALEAGHAARGFLSGGVTFCQLMPMRSIPFRVVCLLGMNDGAYPRAPQPLGFDLMAEQPRVGDRAPRDEDRYLFLEALLSARERFVVTYAGQNERNNVALPPSVLVSELLDVMEESFRCPSGATVRSRVVLQHPLQPFSQRYFGADTDPRLFSYSSAYARGAQTLDAATASPPPFLSRPLPTRHGAVSVLALDDLARYFASPTRTLVEDGLGLRLRDRDEALEDREPMQLQGLARWRLGDALLAGGGSEWTQPVGALEAAVARGALPLGTPGVVAFDSLRAEVSAIVGAAAPWRAGAERDPMPVEIDLGDVRLVGVLRGVHDQALVETHFARPGKGRELSLWVHHLALCCTRGAGIPDVSVTVGLPERGDGASVARFGPVADAVGVLRTLVELYRAGVRMPLPLFPSASRAYVSSLPEAAEDGWNDAALIKARSRFHNTFGGGGEAFDPYVVRVFGDADPLSPAYRPVGDEVDGYRDFDGASRAVFGPLLAAREKVA